MKAKVVLLGIFLTFLSAVLVSGATEQNINVATTGTLVNVTGHGYYTSLAVDPTTGPLALYTFDINTSTGVDDLGSSSLFATYRGTPSWTSSGYLGGGYDLPGVYGQRIALPAGEYLNFTAHDLTLSFWIKGKGSKLGVVYANNYNTQQPGGVVISQLNGANYLVAYLVNSSGALSAPALIGPNLNATQWNHLVITIRPLGGSSYSISSWINGNVISNTPITLANVVYTGMGEANIGNWINHPSGNFTIDEIALYNRSLSGSEIMGLATSQSPRFRTPGIQTISSINMAGTGAENLLNMTLLTTNVDPNVHTYVQLGMLSGTSYVYSQPFELNASGIQNYLLTNPQNISVRISYYSSSQYYTSPYASALYLRSYSNVGDNSSAWFTTPTPTNGARISSQTTNYVPFTIGVNYALLGTAQSITYILSNATSVVSQVSVPATQRSYTFTPTYGVWSYEARVLNENDQPYSTGNRTIIVVRPMNHSLATTAGPVVTKLSQGVQQKVVIVGDSLTYRPSTWTHHLRVLMQARYGDGNLGYVGISPSSAWCGTPTQTCMPSTLSWARSSPAVIYGSVNGPADSNGTFTPDGLYSKIVGNEWVSMTFSGGKTLTFVYVKELSAGTINVTIDGVQRAILPASSLSRQLATSNFTLNGTNATMHTIKFSLVNGTALQYTQLNGIIVLNDPAQGGYSYSRISRGGVGVNDYMALNETAVAQSYQALNPDLYLLMMDPEGAGLNSLRVNLTAFITRVQTATPNAKIVLVSYTNVSTTDWFELQADIVLNQSFASNLGFINLYDLYSYQQLNESGYLDDSIHFSELGGQVYGTYVYNTLINAPSSKTIVPGAPHRMRALPLNETCVGC